MCGTAHKITGFQGAKSLPRVSPVLATGMPAGSRGRVGGGQGCWACKHAGWGGGAASQVTRYHLFSQCPPSLLCPGRGCGSSAIRRGSQHLG